MNRIEQEARLAVLKFWNQCYDSATASHNITIAMANCLFTHGQQNAGNGSGHHGSPGGGGQNRRTGNGQGDGTPAHNSHGKPGSSENNPTTVALLDEKCYWHYMFGGGEPLYVDASTISTENWSYDDLNKNGDGNYTINLFTLSYLIDDSHIAFALGQVILKPLGNDMYEIQDDRYDFNIDGSGFSWRNIATLCGGLMHGVIDDYPIRITPAVFFGGPFNIIFTNREIYIKPSTPHNP